MRLPEGAPPQGLHDRFFGKATLQLVTQQEQFEIWPQELWREIESSGEVLIGPWMISRSPGDDAHGILLPCQL